MSNETMLRITVDIYVSDTDYHQANDATTRIKDYTTGVVSSLTYKGDEHVDASWHIHDSGACGSCENQQYDEICEELDQD